jgi:hypothetical protein
MRCIGQLPPLARDCATKLVSEGLDIRTLLKIWELGPNGKGFEKPWPFVVGSVLNSQP